MQKVFLLTGFEPFGGEKVNPSILACKKLDGRKYNSYMVRVEEIPLRFAEIRGTLEEHIMRHKPAAIISTGQGGGSWLNLERVAINVADTSKVAYNCGEKPHDAVLIERGPAAYFTGLPSGGCSIRCALLEYPRRYPTQLAPSDAIRYSTTSWITS